MIKIFLLACILLNQYVVAATSEKFLKQALTESLENPGSIDKPNWFKSSFLDIKEDIDEALEGLPDAPDRDELLHWLQQQPLLFDEEDYLVVHAGIPPQWSRKKAIQLAEEMHNVLRCEKKSIEFFSVMYGNEPNILKKDLTPPLRWRLITNYLTRMRFCSMEGHLELTCKNLPEKPPKDYAPWFEHKNRKTKKTNIIFGHWAALEGRPCGKRLFPLDTGCVWGGPMRLMNIKTKEYFHS